MKYLDHAIPTVQHSTHPAVKMAAFSDANHSQADDGAKFSRSCQCHDIRVKKKLCWYIEIPPSSMILLSVFQTCCIIHNKKYSTTTNEAALMFKHKPI